MPPECVRSSALSHVAGAQADPCCGFAAIGVLSDRVDAVQQRIGGCNDPNPICPRCSQRLGRVICNLGRCEITLDDG